MSAYDAHNSGGAALSSLDLVGDVDFSALQVLESNVDFMSLLYCHLAACPPHGPFVYYAAMTFVERAKRRYTSAAAAAAANAADAIVTGTAASPETLTSTDSQQVSERASSSLTAEAPGIYPTDADGAQAVLRALTIPNVLALIDRRYDTRHLSSWPLLYVPAEIRGSDVAVLIQQQQGQQKEQPPSQ